MDKTKTYWIQKDGKQDGPYSFGQLLEMTFKSDDLIWEEGSKDWVKVSTVSALHSCINEPKEPTKKNITKIILFSFIGVLVILFGIKLIKNSNDTHRYNISDDNLYSDDIVEIVEEIFEEIVEVFVVNKINVEEKRVIDENRSIEFDASTLWLNSLKNNTLLNYVYGDFLPQDRYSDMTKNEFENSIIEIKKRYFDKTYEEKSESSYFHMSYDVDMEIKFLSGDYLVLEVVVWDYDGGNMGAVSYFKLIDLESEHIMKLSNIVDEDELTHNLLVRCFDKYGMDEGGRKLPVDELREGYESLYYSDDFYFDSENLYFHFHRSLIAINSFGNIVVKVPFKEIGLENLKPSFREKISRNEPIDLEIN